MVTSLHPMQSCMLHTVPMPHGYSAVHGPCMPVLNTRYDAQAHTPHCYSHPVPVHITVLYFLFPIPEPDVSPQLLSENKGLPALHDHHVKQTNLERAELRAHLRMLVQEMEERQKEVGAKGSTRVHG